MPDDSRTLLDSDVLIDLARGYPPAIDLIDGLIAEGERPAISVASEMEFLVGARTKSELRLLTRNVRHFSYLPSLRLRAPYT